MSTRKARRRNHKLEIKDVWHPYGLQSLTQKRFLEVVGKILQGDHSILAIGVDRIHVSDVGVDGFRE